MGTALLASVVSGHMHLSFPKPLNFDNVGPEQYDWWVNKNTFPCLGQLQHLDGARVEAVWRAGSTQKFSLGGSSPHYGGSCQLSLSYDQGKTFKVIKSYPGSCPRRTNANGQEFEFKIPEEAPAGEALFSWSWFNREQEMYHNCALVEIEGNGSGIDHLPNMLVADIDNGCLTPRTNAETDFPDPGEDVVYGDREYPLRMPEGNCL